MQAAAHPEINARGEVKSRIAIGLLTFRQRILLAWLTVGRIAVGVCDLALATAMYLLFLLLQGRAPAHQSWWIPKSILSAALVTSALVMLRALIDIVSSSVTFRQIQNLYTDFLLRLIRGYSEIQWTRFAELNRSELTNHALHTAREAADFYHRLIELIAGGVVVAMMTAAFVYQSPVAALGFACALAAFYCVHRLIIRRRVQRAAVQREKSLGSLQRIVAGMFSSGKEIRTYRNQDFFNERIRQQAGEFTSNHRRATLLPQVARIIADQGTVLLFLAVIAGVVIQRGDARQLLSLLAFYFVLSRRLLPLVSQISLIAGQMESSYENVRIVAAELDMCRRHRAAPLPSILPAPGFVLQLERVNFAFDKAGPILRNVSLALRKGETVILYGVSGIGKTSLLNLIAGVSRPLSGAVRVDRAAIAYVPQEIPLLDDTIRNNLLFGLVEASDEELMKALALARMDDFVAALPHGLETGVGDNGALFSGGERQRLGLARAILRRSQLVLLDEATSALDEENERQVLNNLAATGAAILLVTHRRNAHRFAQRVFRLEDGILVEEMPRSQPAANRLAPTLEPA